MSIRLLRLVSGSTFSIRQSFNTFYFIAKSHSKRNGSLLFTCLCLFYVVAVIDMLSLHHEEFARDRPCRVGIYVGGYG